MEQFTNEQGIEQFRSADGTVYNTDQVVHSLMQDKYILKQFALFFPSGECVSQRYARTNAATICRMIRRYSYEVMLREEMSGDYVECEDTCRYGHMDDVNYSEDHDAWYEDCIPDDDYYDAEHDFDSRRIAGYSDTNGSEEFLTNSYSDASVGYEIEKTHFIMSRTDGSTFTARDHGDYVGEFDIFRGYERDGSCGVEAITHILPAYETFSRVDVYELMEKAKDVIDSPVSKRCGGHFTVSYNRLPAENLLSCLREYLPIFYGMYPDRLKNGYCNSNAKLNNTGLRRRGVVCGRTKALEIRLPAGVKDLKDLWFRHRIICKMMQHAFVLVDSNLDAFINDIRPILREVYSNEEIQNIIKLTKAFNGWIVKDNISIKMADYVYSSIDRETRNKFDLIWARYVRMKVRKRNFRKPLKLGGYFYVQLQTGRKRVTLTKKGLTFKNIILDLNPNKLSRGTISTDGIALEWARASQAEFTFNLVNFTRLPVHTDFTELWNASKGSNYILHNKGVVSFMEGDTFSQHMNIGAHAIGTNHQNMRRLYGQNYVRARYEIKWVNGRPVRQPDPVILTSTII